MKVLINGEPLIWDFLSDICKMISNQMPKNATRQTRKTLKTFNIC